MGQKIHPIGFRVGIIRDWDSRWYSAKDYAKWVYEDYKIRRFLKKDLPRRRPDLASAAISRVEIERAANRVEVTIFSARPGILIGRQGRGLEEIRQALVHLLDPTYRWRAAREKDARPNVDVHVHVQEVNEPDKDAQLVAENIAQQISRRVSYKRAMRQAILRTMRAGALGIKVRVAGRLAGAEMARSEVDKMGKIPLQTIRADVDYGFAEAPTTYGNIGVKVWIYRGDILPGQKVEEESREVTPVVPQEGERPAGRRRRGRRGGRRQRGNADAETS